MFEALYRNPVAKSEESKVDGLVSRMFDYYIHNPGQLPDEFAAIREMCIRDRNWGNPCVQVSLIKRHNSDFVK